MKRSLMAALAAGVGPAPRPNRLLLHGVPALLCTAGVALWAWASLCGNGLHGRRGNVLYYGFGRKPAALPRPLLPRGTDHTVKGCKASRGGAWKAVVLCVPAATRPAVEGGLCGPRWVTGSRCYSAAHRKHKTAQLAWIEGQERRVYVCVCVWCVCVSSRQGTVGSPGCAALDDLR